MPLSFGQEELWKAVERWPSAEPLFHDTIRVRLPHAADLRLTEAALTHLVQRHELLRTTFRTDERGQPYQAIAPSAPSVAVSFADLTTSSPGEKDEVLADLVQRQHAEPFDFAAGPPLRFGLFALDGDASLLAITTAHLVCDVSTEAILGIEVVELHRALRAGEEPRLPDLPIQFADFAVWERALLADARLDEERGWWSRTLEGMPLDIPLPHDRPPSPTGSKSTSAVDFSIPTDVTAAITNLCRRSRSTMYILTVAAVQALVALYTGRSDIVLLTTVNRRDRPELQGVVGPIANGALLRSDLSGDPTFADVVRRARAAVLAMFEHKHLPLEHIVDQLRAHLLAAGVEQHPQVPISVEFFQVPTGPSPSDLSLDGGPPAAERHVAAGSTDVKDIFNPLAIRLFAEDDRLWGRLAYHDAVFDRATAERLVAELKALLEAVAQDSTLRLSELPPVASDQRYARA